MLVKIRNYRSLRDASFDLSGTLNLVVGMNAQGKSSAVSGIAAILTGQALPDGIKKADVSGLITIGMGAGAIDLDGDKFSRHIRYPGCTVDQNGSAPSISTVAAGLETFVSMDKKTLASRIATLLKSEPNVDDLKSEMTQAGLTDEEAIKAVWIKIEAIGWDGALKWAQDNGTKAKGAWEQITGDNYGSQKAKSWHPTDWDARLDFKSLADVESASQLASLAYEEAIKSGAVDDSNRGKMQIAADSIPGLKERLQATANEMGAKATQITELTNERLALGRPGYVGVPCPHCQGHIVIETVNGRHTLAKADTTVNEATVKDANMKIASLDGRISKLNSEIGNLKRDRERTEEDLSSAEKARDQLSGAQDGSDGDNLAKLKQDMETTKRAHTMVLQIEQAKAKQGTITNILTLIDVLSPTGIRQRKAMESREAFNSKMETLCQDASWPIVSLSEDMAWLWGMRAYPLCSESEKWRLRAIIQIATAQIDGSFMVLFDGADILTGRAREPLFKMLLECGLKAVIGMSVATPLKRHVPDLAEMGIGQTFWISDGSAKPVSEMPERNPL